MDDNAKYTYLVTVLDNADFYKKNPGKDGNIITFICPKCRQKTSPLTRLTSILRNKLAMDMPWDPAEVCEKLRDGESSRRDLYGEVCCSSCGKSFKRIDCH